MAYPEVVQEQFNRLVAHSARWLTDEEYDTLLADWCETLKRMPDFAVVEAGDEMSMLGKMPSMNDMLGCTQRHARDSLPSAWLPPPLPETDPHPDDYAHGVMATMHDYLKANKVFSNFDDTWGHNHKGPSPCSVCGGLSPKVGEPGPRPEPFLLSDPREDDWARFGCSCGEMNGWVEVVDKRFPTTLTVRPCERCQPDRYTRWLETK